MAAYVRTFDDNVTISFKISDKQLFKEYNQIRTKVEKLLKIEFIANLFMVMMINT